MSLNIKNPATVAFADELARRQAISKTAAIHQALSDLTMRGRAVICFLLVTGQILNRSA